MPRPRVAEEQQQAPGHADQQQMDGNNKAAPPMPEKTHVQQRPQQAHARVEGEKPAVFLGGQAEPGLEDIGRDRQIGHEGHAHGRE